MVEGKGNYYTALLDYIHLNPVRAGLVKPEAGQSVMDYPWSSVAGGYALGSSKRAKWLAASAGLGAFDLPDTVAGRRRFVERLDRRASAEGLERAGVPASDAEVDARMSHMRRGWYWGSREFAERVLKLGDAVLSKARHRSYKAAWESRAHGEREALRLLDRGLSAAGLTAGDFDRLPGTDKRKVAIARACYALWRAFAGEDFGDFASFGKGAMFARPSAIPRCSLGRCDPHTGAALAP